MPDERARVRAAASACHAALGHAQGAAWLVCVQTTLIQEPAGFPVQQEATLLKDLLLNYTCDVDDGGTPAIRSVMWSWRPTGSATVPVSLRVDVLQESPPILLVDDFVSDAECQYMVNASMGDMMPSPGYPSSGTRRSYSASLFPKWDLEGDVVARVSRRLVAFAHEVGGYPDIPEVGQEPLSTVYYREAGDEFRSHCDGECRGGAYWAGRRIATSLTYCKAAQESAARPNAAPLAWLLLLGLLSLGLLSLGLPSHRSCSRLASPGTAVPLAQPCNTPPTVCRVTQEGGNTIFSLSAIKVVPRERRMLFFGYKLRGAAARSKLVVPSIDKAQTCRPGQRRSGPPTAGSALPAPTSARQPSGPQSRAWAARPPRRSPGASPMRRDNAGSTTFDHPGSRTTDAMDGGLSEHAGCPIRSGTKVVLTQWLREAVTAERDWRHYARLDDEETFRNAVSPTRPLSPSPSPSPPPFPSPLPSPQCGQPLTAAEARQTAAPPAPSPSMRAWVAPPLELGTGAVSHSESLTSRALLKPTK